MCVRSKCTLRAKCRRYINWFCVTQNVERKMCPPMEQTRKKMSRNDLQMPIYKIIMNIHQTEFHFWLPANKYVMPLRKYKQINEE